MGVARSVSSWKEKKNSLNRNVVLTRDSKTNSEILNEGK
jgi:hypothetical protein